MLIVFNTGFTLLDVIVLTIVSGDAEGTYGYEIVQDVWQAIDILESTLYPVPRRLREEGCLKVYDIVVDGRNHRYYRLTGKGRVQLNSYRGERIAHSQEISQTFKGAKL